MHVFSNEFLLQACGQTDSGTAAHTFTPLQINVIVPSYLRYVGLIIIQLLIIQYNNNVVIIQTLCAYCHPKTACLAARCRSWVFRGGATEPETKWSLRTPTRFVGATKCYCKTKYKSYIAFHLYCHSFCWLDEVLVSVLLQKEVQIMCFIWIMDKKNSGVIPRERHAEPLLLPRPPARVAKLAFLLKNNFPIFFYFFRSTKFSFQVYGKKNLVFL